MLALWKFIFYPNRKPGFHKSPVINGTPAEQLVKQAALRLMEEDAAIRASNDLALSRPTVGNSSTMRM